MCQVCVCLCVSVCGLEAMPSVQAACSCQACAGLVHVRENSVHS